jgi:hypothetical protein
MATRLLAATFRGLFESHKQSWQQVSPPSLSRGSPGRLVARSPRWRRLPGGGGQVDPGQRRRVEAVEVVEHAWADGERCVS